MNARKHNMVTPSLASRYMGDQIREESVPRDRLPERGMDPRLAYQLIRDELQTQGNPTLNMASFVTTIMDDECDRLIAENLGVNYIDTEVYRANLEIQTRCVKILGDLCGAHDTNKVWGTQCVGSSEALILAMLSHKRAWMEKKKKKKRSETL